MKKSMLLLPALLLAIFYSSVFAAENITDEDTIKGTVVIEFVVTKEGKVKDPKIIESVPPGVFDKAALEEAEKLRYTPPRENGRLVETTITKIMNFKMSANESEAGKASSDGIKHLRNGEYENALLDFSTAIGIAPENGQYYDLRGQVYYVMENYRKAVADYNKAIEKKPDMVDAYFDRGEALRKLGNYREAIEDYTKVISLDGNYLQAYNSRAVSYNKLKETESMCRDLKRVCELGDCRGIEAARKADRCN